MSSYGFRCALMCCGAILSSCGAGYGASKYEPHPSPNRHCTEMEAPSAASNLVRKHPSGFAFGDISDDILLRPLRIEERLVEYEIQIRGIPHCTRTLLGVGNNSLVSHLEKFPPIDERQGWIEIGDTLDLINADRRDPFVLTARAKACFFEQGERMVPAWRLEGMRKNRPVRLYGNGDEIFRVESLQFGVTGTAVVYDSHPGSPMVEVPLRDLDGSGLLRGRRFITEVPADYPVAIADGPDFSFRYDPADKRFREVSAFANAERMANFFAQEKFGYTMDCLPIHIRVPDRFRDQVGLWQPINNASYIPSSFNPAGSFPLILLGEGDGVGLKDLVVDADVMFHELGHHVVYRTLKSTSYESKVIHEALADFFVFAKTNNACVAEGVCPPGSEDCWKPGCLRTGINQLKLTDVNLPTGAHRRSQVLSGMLWDMRVIFGPDVVDTLVFKAVDYLLWESRYEDLVFALLAADLELNGGSYACRIHEFAQARGLGERISKISCNDFSSSDRHQL